MPAIITDPPILIDAIGYSRQSNAEINPVLFPFSITKLYNGLARNISAGGQLFTANNPWKSADTAATWTIQDATNSPGRRDSWWSERAGIIRASLIDTFSNIRVTPFDTATDTWGTTSDPIDIGTNPRNEGAVLVDKPNGDVVYFWCDFSANTLNCAVLSAGVWTGPTLLITFPDGFVFVNGGVCDSLGRVHLVIGGTGIDANVLNYVLIENDLTPNSPVSIGTTDFLRADLKISGDTLAINWTSADNTTQAAIGTPLSAPVFTGYTVEAATGSAVVSYAAIAKGLDGKWNSFWVWTDYSGPSPYVDEIHQSTFDGATWSTPILFYDAVTNPPANDVAPIDQFIHTMDMPNQFPNGRWIPYIGLEVIITPGGGEACAGFMLVSPASTLNLPCPIVTSPAVVGQPFTETLIASGGTPPYTYGVAVGYALPPGLTLDPTTGLISGIPTAIGVFEVAYTVTDSLGNTARTIGTCPIPVGQQGSPCENPGTNPSLDSYLELRKVLVAWKREAHLPVRGKS